MKAYKFEIVVIDFEGYGAKEYRTLIEQHRHLNGNVIGVKEADIGEWDDEHMLNKNSTPRDAIRALFETPAEVDLLKEEVKRLKSLLHQIASIKDKMYGGDWDEIEEAREIARLA